MHYYFFRHIRQLIFSRSFLLSCGFTFIIIITISLYILNISAKNQYAQHIFAYFSGVFVTKSFVLKTDLWMQPQLITTLLTPYGEFAIRETLENGDFSNQYYSWQTYGEVELITDPAIIRKFGHSSYEQFVRIGSLNGSFLDENRLRYEWVDAQTEISAVGFWYRAQSIEDSWGFDEPMFQVFINDSPVYSLSAFELLSAGTWPLDSGWQYLSIHLEHLPVINSLEFRAGNQVDLQAGSQVYLAGVTSNVITTNQDNELLLSNNLNLPATYHLVFRTIDNIDQYYSVSGVSALLSYSQWPLNQMSQAGLLTIWLESINLYPEQKSKIYHHLTRSSPTPISDPIIMFEGDQEISIVFTVPPDPLFDRFKNYHVRSSHSPLTTEEDWHQFSTKQIVSHGLTMLTPKRSGHTEDLLILDIPSEHHFLHLRIEDFTGAFSPIYSHSL